MYVSMCLRSHRRSHRRHLHAADLIQECANAISAGSTLEDLSMMVHTHPTLCEVLDEAFKAGLGRSAH